MSVSLGIHSPAVLLVSNYSNNTGYAWNNIHNLYAVIAAELKKHGLEVIVSFDRFQPPLTWGNPDNVSEVIELRPIPSTFLDFVRWFKAIRQYRIRYLYLTDQATWSLRYLLYRIAGIRCIVVHCRVSVADPFPARPEKGLKGWLKWIANRMPLIHVTRVYAVSDFVRDRLIHKAKVPPQRVIKILNGVDIDKLTPVNRVEHGDKITIFCGGRATIYKGIDVLIESAFILKNNSSVKPFVIRYAGDGPDIAQFKSLVSKRGLESDFIFLGELPSAHDEIANADIVVVPSAWGDACPSAISEALACGKPLVATRVGGVPEIIGHDGAAIMVEPGNPNMLAHGLESLINSHEARNKLAIAARKRAESVLCQRRYHDEVVDQLRRDFEIDCKDRPTSGSHEKCSR